MELGSIVRAINSTQSYIEGSTLFCPNYEIIDTHFIDELITHSLLEEEVLNNVLGQLVNLNFSLPYLKLFDFFKDWHAAIDKYRYELPEKELYLYEIRKYASEDVDFKTKHETVVKFIQAVVSLAKHTYDDLDDKKCILHREDKSVFLSLKYSYETLYNLEEATVANVQKAIDILSKDKSEKKSMFLNEVIEFNYPKSVNHSVNHLLNRFDSFFENFEEAYQYYLSNFSFNKLKLELDSKSLDYTTKIRNVISEAQSKLIAIPSAFILVGITLDYSDINNVKNYVILIGIIAFAVLLEIFIRNQKSGLRIIADNIKSYKSTLNNNIDYIDKSFSTVVSELKKQKDRLRIIQIILWTLTIALIGSFLFVRFCTILYLVKYMGFLFILLITIKYNLPWIE